MIAALLTAGAVLAAVRTVSPPPPETVEVLVAAHDLPSGAVLDDDDLVVRAYPADLAPPDTADAAAGRVLAGPVGRGEVLTDVRLVGPALAAAGPGETVLPVRLPDAGMAALLHAGDRIDLLATDPGTGETRVVASGVTVLATPTGVPDGPAGGGGGALVVIAASSGQASAVASAALAQFLTVAWNR